MITPTKIIPPIFLRYCCVLSHMCTTIFFSVGIRYGGNSSTKGVSLFLKNVLLKTCAVRKASKIPVKYIDASTNPGFFGKNAEINKTYTGNLALHDMNGIISMVRRRSPGFRRVRVAMMAGTLQPNPITSGINDRP